MRRSAFKGAEGNALQRVRLHARRRRHRLRCRGRDAVSCHEFADDRCFGTRRLADSLCQREVRTHPASVRPLLELGDSTPLGAGLRYLAGDLGSSPLYWMSGKELAPVEDQSAVAVILQGAPDSTLEANSKWASTLATSLKVMPETKIHVGRSNPHRRLWWCHHQGFP